MVRDKTKNKKLRKLYKKLAIKRVRRVRIVPSIKVK
jgi:hypothetical protein